jgi:hypothetical protein
MGLKEMGWQKVDWTHLAQKQITDSNLGCCKESIKPSDSIPLMKLE